MTNLNKNWSQGIKSWVHDEEDPIKHVAFHYQPNIKKTKKKQNLFEYPPKNMENKGKIKKTQISN